VLKGYINHHVEVCPYDTCPIKNFIKLIEKERLENTMERKRKGNRGGG